MHKLKDVYTNLKHNHPSQPRQPILSPSHLHLPPRDDKPADPALLSITQRAIDVFLASLQENGEIGGLGHWQSACGYNAILLHDLSTSTPSNLAALTTAFSNISKHYRGFCNEFCDDTLWWGNCLIDLYLLSRRTEYFHTAMRLHKYVSEFVIKQGQYTVRGHDMRGGVFWTTKQDEQQVNSISTGLYAEVSARLAGLLGDDCHQKRELVDAAEASLDWILRCRFKAEEGVVLDHVILDKDECVDWAFTYLTGQGISACAALIQTVSRTSGRDDEDETGRLRRRIRCEEYLHLACDMARKSIRNRGWVNGDGVLTEEGVYGKDNHEEWRNDDAVGFKSILIRALAKLYKVLVETNREPQLREEIKVFMERQYQCLQENNTNGRDQYGPWWAGPMALPTSHSQLAVLDVMAAIHVVA